MEKQPAYNRLSRLLPALGPGPQVRKKRIGSWGAIPPLCRNGNASGNRGRVRSSTFVIPSRRACRKTHSRQNSASGRVFAFYDKKINPRSTARHHRRVRRAFSRASAHRTDFRQHRDIKDREWRSARHDIDAHVGTRKKGFPTGGTYEYRCFDVIHSFRTGKSSCGNSIGIDGRTFYRIA